MDNVTQLVIFALIEFAIFGTGILLVYKQQKKQTRLIESIILNEDYAAKVGINLLFGVMENIQNDKEKAEIFFGFVNACSVNGFAAIREYLGHAAANPDLKGVPPVMKKIIKTANSLGIDLKGIAKQKVSEGAEAALEGWS